MKNILVLLLCLGLVGCVTAQKMNKLNLGMTKAEVIKVMGNPTSISAKGNTEYLNYRLKETTDMYEWGTMYFIRIIDGKVDSYGRLGDFDSTKVPESKATIDLNIEKE